jgi:flagella basal body P-ring formation protein FlgA
MLVKAGEPVVIEVVSGGIRVEALGRARQSGSLGDMIRVENVDSRKIIYARVVAAGVVRLDLSSGD